MINNVNGANNLGCIPTNNNPGSATITQERGFAGQVKTVIDAGEGNDNINVHTNRNGSVDVTINGQKYSFTREQAKNLEVRGGAGDDAITSSSSNRGGLRGLIDRHRQSANNIILNGGDGNDRISGGRGNEVITGGNGNDVLNGGDGNDLIFGGNGNDIISGGRGNDAIFGGVGNDHIAGNAGNDFIRGDNGNDMIDGGRGRDTIHGGEGNDVIRGGRGLDYIRGDQGNDIVADRGHFRKILRDNIEA